MPWEFPVLASIAGNRSLRFGTVNRPPLPICGQELRILTHAFRTVCEELFAEESDLYLNELVIWLALTYDVSISIPTLSRNFKEAGLTRKLLHRLTVERDEEYCHEWKVYCIKHHSESNLVGELTKVNSIAASISDQYNGHETQSAPGLELVQTSSDMS